MKRAIEIVFVAAVATSPSCGGNEAIGTGPGPAPQLGFFTAAVSGTMSASLTGSAIFGPVDNSGTTQWSIAFVSGNVSESEFDFIAVARDEPEAPGSGTFTIGNALIEPPESADFLAEYTLRRNGELDTFLSKSGSIDITVAGPDQVEGSFSFVGFSIFTGFEVTVQGVFNAEPGTITRPVP